MSILRCRWCAYTCPAFYRTRDGQTRNGYVRLGQHARDEHPCEYGEAALTLNAEDPGAPLLDDPFEPRAGYVPSDPFWQEDEALP